MGELSAIDNLALSHGFARTALGNIRWPEMERRTSALVERFGLGIDVRRPLSTATPVQRTVVAIAAALQGWEGRRGVLVLDEPTAVLPPGEVARLFDIVREVRDAGAGVLYVSHRMDEIFALADRVTVIRGGRRIATRPVAELTPRSLAELMAGEEMETDHRPAPFAPPALPIPCWRSATCGPGSCGESASTWPRVNAWGSPVWSAPATRSCRTRCAAPMPGRVSGTAAAAGTVRAVDQARDAHGLGLPLVPADRAGEGVIGDFSVGENLTLPLLEPAARPLRAAAPPPRVRPRGGLDPAGRRAYGGRGARITTLSGGNQQKVVMARCLAQRPPVLTLCEPTAGVDIATRLQLYDLIERQADEGMGVIVSLLRHAGPARAVHPRPGGAGRPDRTGDQRPGHHRARARARHGRNRVT